LERKKSAGLKDVLESKRKGMEIHTHIYIYIIKACVFSHTFIHAGDGRQENPGKETYRTHDCVS
jgi:hypothetical protein